MAQTPKSIDVSVSFGKFGELLTDLHRVAFLTYSQSPAEVEAGEEPEFVYADRGMDEIRGLLSEFFGHSDE